MKIKTDILVEFLKKVNMNGNERIEEALFNFTETGLQISAVSPTKVNRVDAILKSSAFENYEAIKEIGIQDISTLIKIIKTFKNMVDLKVEGNTIILFNGSKEMKTELIDTQFINAVDKLKDLEFSDMFTIDSGLVKEAIEDANINEEFSLKFKTVEKGFLIATTGKYKFNRQFKVEEAKGGVEVSFGSPFINAFMQLTGKVELNLKNNFPIKILEKTENSVINFIVAPTIKKE